MDREKEKEKNIATSTSAFYEEYIDKQPNRFQDDTTEQQGVPFEEPVKLNAGRRLAHNVTATFILTLATITIIWGIRKLL